MIVVTRHGLKQSMSIRSLSHLSQYSTKTRHDPLRILFCGSDAFSIASLEALLKEHELDPSVVASIDVVCRQPKATGRGLKAIRQVPILSAAKNLSLPVHTIDTFTGWKPPTPGGEKINLVAAVSFGLLIPARIISGAKYGGVNVHPSLLPQYEAEDMASQLKTFIAYNTRFRGAAPLHHTLLSGTEVTGVTLQTLHPTKFDHGIILAQTPPFGHGTCTVPALAKVVAPIGAKLLVQGITDGVFVTPPGEHDQVKASSKDDALLTAPKISRSDQHIEWKSWTAEKILRRHRVVGPLWNHFYPGDDPESKPKRLIWESGFRKLSNCPESIRSLVLEAGLPIAVGLKSKVHGVYIKTCDGQMLQAYKLKVGGEPGRDFLSAARRFNMVELPEALAEAPCDYKLFNSVLS